MTTSALQWILTVLLLIAVAVYLASRDNTPATPPPGRDLSRIGVWGLGPRIEHIPRRQCPDCRWHDDDGEPIEILCLVHDKPDPDDDLHLWDAELDTIRQPASRGREKPR